MPSPTRADLENAAIGFFRTLERELDQPRGFHPDNIAAEVDFNVEESRNRVRSLDLQLVINQFDRATYVRAQTLLDELAVDLDSLLPEQKLFALQLIPRLADQNLCAQVRSPKVMMRQG